MTTVRTPNRFLDLTHVIVEFTDTEVGMTEEQSRRLFTSLLNTTEKTGTGMGLAIVAKVVEAHCGQAKVKSRPEKG